MYIYIYVYYVYACLYINIYKYIYLPRMSFPSTTEATGWKSPCAQMAHCLGDHGATSDQRFGTWKYPFSMDCFKEKSRGNHGF